VSIFTLSGSMNHKIKQRSKLRECTLLRFKARGRSESVDS
jgi:hypothetical protein